MGERENDRLREIRARMALHPLRNIGPKHRTSGPYPQFEGPVCSGCKRPTVGGRLHEVFVCGACREAVDRLGDGPRPAA